MKRVLQLIPTLDRGGAEQQLALLASGMKRAGWNVHVACLTRGGPWEAELRASDVPVTVLNKRWKIDPLAYLRLLKLVRELRPDIVHTWLFAANCYGRWAAQAARVPRILASERCVDEWKTPLHFALDRQLAKTTSRITTNSSGVVDFYASHGVPREKFAVIPNGIPERQPGSRYPREQLLAELGLPSTAKLIGAVGRLWPQKRYKDLIWSLDLLQCVVDDVHLVIIGAGPQRWRLERYASQVSENDRIHFLGERSDVADILPHLDCFWLGSGYEGQSNALLEALAAGVPVVATDIPGNREIITPGETGILVPVGDRASFAGRTRDLLNSPELLSRFRAAGPQRVRERFGVEQMVRSYCELYESC